MAKNQAVEEVVPKADKLMYEAKETKNTIVTEWERSGDKDEMIQYSRKHSRQCILIVDDSEINRAILYEMLHQDYDILEAESGERCIRMLEEYEREISLLLLDIVMPGHKWFWCAGADESKKMDRVYSGYYDIKWEFWLLYAKSI